MSRRKKGPHRGVPRRRGTCWKGGCKGPESGSVGVRGPEGGSCLRSRGPVVGNDREPVRRTATRSGPSSGSPTRVDGGNSSSPSPGSPSHSFSGSRCPSRPVSDTDVYRWTGRWFSSTSRRSGLPSVPRSSPSLTRREETSGSRRTSSSSSISFDELSL